MRPNTNDLRDFGVVELTLEERAKVTAGAESVFYYVGWAIGAAVAMPIVVVAAATLAVVTTANSGYQASGQRMA